MFEAELIPNNLRVAIKAFHHSMIEKKKLSTIIDNEVWILKYLSSQGIIWFYESFEHHNHWFIVMELVDGETLT